MLTYRSLLILAGSSLWLACGSDSPPPARSGGGSAGVATGAGGDIEPIGCAIEDAGTKIQARDEEAIDDAKAIHVDELARLIAAIGGVVKFHLEIERAIGRDVLVLEPATVGEGGADRGS